MADSKLFWFDVETTGLDSKLNDIIQLGCLIEINGKIEEEYNFLCQPFNYKMISAKALEINRSNVKDLKLRITPQETYDKLIKILDKHIDKYNREDKFYPAGYNVRFDVDFLNNFFRKNNNNYYGSYFDYHLLSIDVLIHLLDYRGLIKLENYKLVTVAKHFGLQLNAHDALSDIKVTRQVMYKLFNYLKGDQK